MSADSSTSAGISGLARPAIAAATKIAQANKVKKVSLKIKIKKKVK
jgi:hypothetical protein